MKPFFKTYILPYVLGLLLLIAVIPVFSWYALEGGTLLKAPEMVYAFWVPAVASLLFLILLDRRCFKSLYLGPKVSRMYIGITFLFVLVVSVMGHHYFSFVLPEVKHIANISEIEDGEGEVVAQVDNFYAAKNKAQIHTDTKVSDGKSPEYLMRIYVTVPLFDTPEDTLKLVPDAWLGVKYRLSIPNATETEEKMERYRVFTQESQAAFMAMDLQGLKYFDQNYSKNVLKGFKKAAKFSPNYRKDTPIIEGKEYSPKERAGEKLLLLMGIAIAALLLYSWMIWTKLPKVG